MAKGFGSNDDTHFINAPYRISVAFHKAAGLARSVPASSDGYGSPYSLRVAFQKSTSHYDFPGGTHQPLSADKPHTIRLKSTFRKAALSTYLPKEKKAKKKRPSPITWRPPLYVRQIFYENVKASGLTAGGYMTQTLANVEPPRRSRRPTATHKELAQIIGQLGKVGGNLNQLAKAAHMGEEVEGQLSVALDDISEIRAVCMKSMGMKP